MALLAKPDLPDGALKALNDALHDLHRQTLYPSLAAMARATNMTRETVRRLFSGATLPVAKNLFDVVAHLATLVRRSDEKTLNDVLDQVDVLFRAAEDEIRTAPATSISGPESTSSPELSTNGAELITSRPLELATELVNALAREYGAGGLEDWIAPSDPKVAADLSELVVDAMAENGEVEELKRKTESGDAYAGQRLAEYYAEQGDDDELHSLAQDDLSVAKPHAQYQLQLRLWADHTDMMREPIEPLDERLRRRLLVAGSLLTLSEQEIAILISKRMSNQQIAETLTISLQTVKTHIHNIMMKFGVTDRAEVAARLLPMGYDSE
jgi:DNA-binding CsgD family transcriptional regulator